MSSNTITLSPIYYPTQISSCVLWLDGADPFANGILPTNGSTIGTWKNKGTSAINVSNSGSPTFSNAIINNNGAVRFPGSAYLQDTGFIHTLSNKTYFLVTQGIDSTNPTTQGIMYFGNNGFVYNTQNGIAYQGPESAFNNQFGFLQAYGNGGYYYSFGSSYSNTPLGIYGDTCSNTSASIYVNGSNLSNFTLSYTPQNSTGFRMGRRVDSLGQYYNGYICEVLAFNTLLNTSQRQQTEGYLAWKWGLQTSLPSNHPYKNTPVYTPNTLPPQFRSNLASIPFAQSLSPFSFFSPRTISGCRLWLDGYDPNGNGTAVSNGTSISSWVDKSGSGNNATQATASNRPSYLNNTILYNGSNVLSLPNGTLPSGSSETTMFIIVSVTNTSNVQYFFGAGNGVTNEAFNIYTDVNTLNLDVFGTRARGAFTSTSTNILGFTFGSSTLTIYTNGSVNSSQGTVTKSTGTANNSIGASSGSSGGSPFYFTGSIGETLIYNSLLSTLQRQQVEGYLAWKWGLQGNLPSTHPYKNVPPGLPVPSVPLRLTMNNSIFSPLNISGLQFWLDASVSSGLTLSGTTVTQINDRSGSNNNLTPVAGLSNGVIQSNYQNSLSVINFSGSNLYRSSSSGIYPNDVFVIVALKSLSGITDIIGMGNTGSDNFNSLTLGEYTATRWHNGSSGFSRTPNTVSSTDETSTGFLIMNWSIANNNFVINRNGTQLSQTASYTYTPGSPSAFQIGYRQPLLNTPPPLNAYMGEMLIYNSQLSRVNRQLIEGYLAWKWGLQGNLPSNHPWKKWPPPPS